MLVNHGAHCNHDVIERFKKLICEAKNNEKLEDDQY